MFYNNVNDSNRQAWLKRTLSAIPAGKRILDAGAGELRNRPHCVHLDYVSQDFGQYKGEDGGAPEQGLQLKAWDTRQIDLVSDIASIPAPDASFDVILCSEVLEHVPEPTHALEEFTRLLKPGGKLILTAPFASLVHMAPYHYSSGFSKYWYEYHLEKRGFDIDELSPNGDWFLVLKQEISRLGGMERQEKSWIWPLAYAFSILGWLYFTLRPRKSLSDLATFGWHCVATKRA